MRFVIGAFILFVTMTLSGCKDDEPTIPVEESIDIQTFLDKKIEEIESIEFDYPISDLIRHCDIYDNINDRIWKYNVILPPQYSSKKSYPVLYLLHGKSGNYDNWVTSMKIQKTLDYYYAEGFPDIIIIMPDASDTYYLDYYLDDIRYESFFNKIFCPTVEKLYSVSQKRNDRFIGGLSMGGYGALTYSLKNNGNFSFCYAMSAPVAGSSHPLLISPLNYLNGKNPSEIPYIILDIGFSDQFFQDNLDVLFELESYAVLHEIITREGGHNAKFWSECLILLFDRLRNYMENPKIYS